MSCCPPKRRFDRVEQIPEKYGSLLLSEGSKFRGPKAEAHTDRTTTAREVAMIFSISRYREDMKLHVAATYLMIVKEGREFFKPGNNFPVAVRTIVRTMLDPDRFAPVDMSQAYEHEINLVNEQPVAEDQELFDGFVDRFGLLEDRVAALPPQP